MSDFSGKQFYGSSIEDDPDLATTTSNFQFRYVRPEYLERAIQKIHREQMMSNRNRSQISQNFSLHQHQQCKHTQPMKDLSQLFEPNDFTKRERHQSVRDLTKHEIEHLIQKAKVTSTPLDNPNIELEQEYLQRGRENNALHDHLDVDFKQGQCFTKESSKAQVAQVTPRYFSPKKMNFTTVECISFGFQEEKIPKETKDSKRTTSSSSPIRSKGIQRQCSQFDKLDQFPGVCGSPKPLIVQTDPKNKYVSKATSPIISPRSAQSSPRVNSKPVFKSTGTSPLTSPRKSMLQKPSFDNDSGHNEVLNQTYNLPEDDSEGCRQKQRIYHIEEYAEEAPQVPQVVDYVRMEDYHLPQAKWVEIQGIRNGKRYEKKVVHKRKKVVEKSSSRSDNYKSAESICLNTGSQKSNEKLGIQNFLPTLLMTEVIKGNVRTPGGASVNVNSHNGGLHEVVDNVVVEDSDMEFEIKERPHYTKFIKSKPMDDEVMRRSEGYVYDDDDEGGLAEFLEIEKGATDFDVRYLRNASPMYFTEITEDDNQLSQSPIKIIINDKEGKGRRLMGSENTSLTCSNPELYSPGDNQQPAKDRKRRSGGASQKEQRLQETFDRLSKGGRRPRECPPAPNNSTADRLPQRSARSHKDFNSNSCSPMTGRRQSGNYTERGPYPNDRSAETYQRRQMPTQLRISKSIEDQKKEKTLIFQKMADVQVRIIEVLDKLKMGLLELNAPKNVLEKNKRQKNALEFAVRFSRNFLYPLKGLLQELELTPPDQFNSLHSNEACNRVFYVYNLLLQALKTYHKQLRYFHLDHVPQKLPQLIEIIHNATVLCLEKNIFSRQDERISFLQHSCQKFLDFLQQLQDGSLNSARENYRKLTLEKASPRYELKMVMNPLNMYEPKLVPKTPLLGSNSNTSRKRTNDSRHKRHIVSVPVEEGKDQMEEKPQDDLIPTHVQSYALDSKSSNELSHPNQQQANVGSGDCVMPALDKSILEAMRHMTQEQVKQILEPILKSLSSALGQQSPENIASITQALRNVAMDVKG